MKRTRKKRGRGIHDKQRKTGLRKKAARKRAAVNDARRRARLVPFDPPHIHIYRPQPLRRHRVIKLGSHAPRGVSSKRTWGVKKTITKGRKRKEEREREDERQLRNRFEQMGVSSGGVKKGRNSPRGGGTKCRNTRIGRRTKKKRSRRRRRRKS